MNKQLLVLPDTKRFKPAQIKELNDAGFVVVYLQDTSQARVLSAEPLPVASDDVTISALRALRKADDSNGYRLFVDGLIAAASSQNRDSGGQS